MAHAHEHAHEGDFDQGFLSKLVGHHQGAIDMAQVATTRAEHDEIKQFARQLISDQRAEQQQIRQWLQQWYGGASDGGGMDMAAMQADVERLQQAQPFDRAFIDAMVPHHEQAVQMAQPALDQAKHAEVKQMAQEMIAKQQQEIEKLQGWRSQWYGA